jgi:ATP-dependent protease HslVU (ClpYQ) peptidase subunit
MTCIAVVRDNINNKIWMAGDRGVSDDNSISVCSSPKIWKKEGYLFGYAGSMDGDRIKHLFVPPEFEGRGSIDKFMYSKFLKALRKFYEEWWVDVSPSSDFGMIICVRGKIYEHNASDMSLTQYEQDYLAMGSGGDLALGSLYSTQKQKDARKRAVTAVNAAITHSMSCKGPIDILSV